jgi:hypothetical protein
VRKRMLCRALERSQRGSFGGDTSFTSLIGRTSQFDEIRGDLEMAFDELGHPVMSDMMSFPGSPVIHQV